MKYNILFFSAFKISKKNINTTNKINIFITLIELWLFF